jgi:hypothetical protein
VKTRRPGRDSQPSAFSIFGEINMQDEHSDYHSTFAYVYIGERAFILDEIWSGVDAAERAGVSLGEIGQTLTHDWTAAVTALALGNIGVLRALVDEASP